MKKRKHENRRQYSISSHWTSTVKTKFNNVRKLKACEAAASNNPCVLKWIHLKWMTKLTKKVDSGNTALNDFLCHVVKIIYLYFKFYDLFFRNISTVSFSMLRTSKSITAQCLAKSRNSPELSPPGTPTQSGNRRRRLRESRRRGWGDLW